MVKNISLAFFLLAYLGSYVGVWVHRCTNTGSVDIALIESHLTCEKLHVDHSHHSSGSCTGDCGCESHDSDCCHTDQYHSDDCTVGQDGRETLSSLSEILFSADIVEYISSAMQTYSGSLYLSFREAPPLFLYRSESYLACWRL